MSQNISLYNFKGHEIRIYGTDDEPWFVAKDVANALGIVNHHNVVASLKPHQKALHTVESLGGVQETTIISEGAVYKMITKSRKPEAEAFTDWVFDEILPSIRKKGRYELEQEKKELLLKISNLEKRQFVSYGCEGIPISKRVIELGYISQQLYDKAMCSIRINIDGEEMEARSPKSKKILRNLANISKKVATMYRIVKGRRANISYKGKYNEYLPEDYILFGDNVIHEYFRQKPLETWGL